MGTFIIQGKLILSVVKNSEHEGVTEIRNRYFSDQSCNFVDYEANWSEEIVIDNPFIMLCEDRNDNL